MESTTTRQHGSGRRVGLVFERCGQDDLEKIAEGVDLSGGEAGEGSMLHVAHPARTLGADLVALGSEAVADGATGAWYPLDESALDHPRGQCPERLVRLKGQLRQVM